MERLTREDKIYLDKENTKESHINMYLNCRDGIVEVIEYRDTSGYGSETRLFLCKDTKHEAVAIIRQTKNLSKEWNEEVLDFDSDSFEYLEKLLKGDAQTIRDYSEE